MLCIIVPVAAVTGCGSQSTTQVKDYLNAIGEVTTESADILARLEVGN